MRQQQFDAVDTDIDCTVTFKSSETWSVRAREIEPPGSKHRPLKPKRRNYYIDEDA